MQALFARLISINVAENAAARCGDLFLDGGKRKRKFMQGRILFWNSGFCTTRRGKNGTFFSRKKEKEGINGQKTPKQDESGKEICIKI